MAFLPVNLDGQLGLVRDLPGHVLAPAAWTDVKNVRMDDQVAGSIAGHEERYATPTIDPYSLFYVPGESTLFWTMAGLTDVICHDASSYAEITRPTAVPFASGSEEPDPDDEIEGAVSGATGKFVSVTVDTGTWGGGDAAGTIYLYDVVGAFNGTEDLDNNTSTTANIATMDGAATGGDYSGGENDRWNGGVLSGILVLNNSGVDNPQYWASASTSVRLADLPNWPANTKARIIRPFLNVLVALDITVSGIRRPYLVRWSHGADAGAIPSSWDVSDASLDAGQFDLGQTKDFLVDSLSLGQNVNIIYKEETAWIMQFIGHPYIFQFVQISGMPGMFSQQCGVEITKGRHAVLTRGDFIIHNGQSFESAIDGRNRKFLFNAIDPTNWSRTFVAHNPRFNEVWVCFPSIGAERCDQALIWNYRENTWFHRDLPLVSDIKLGIVNPSVEDTWDAGPATSWDGGADIPWDSTQSDPTQYKMLMASPDNTKVYEPDVGNTFDGVVFTSYVEREGLALEPTRRQDSLTINTESWKCLRGVRPRFSTPPVGESVEVWIGTQNHVNAASLWHGPFIADADNDYKVDFIHSARLFGVRFQAQDAFKIDGYDLDVDRTGMY